MSPPLPPRLAIALLERRIPHGAREYFVGDLVERFHDDVAHGRAARWRFWRETLLALIARWPSTAATPAIPRPVPGDGTMLGFASDFRLALRAHRRAPLFALVAVFTLAIGIGAASAIYSVVYPVLVADPPYPDPDRLMLVWEREKGGAQSNLGYATFEELNRDGKSWQSMAAVSYWSPTLVGPDEAEPLAGQRVTARFFETLGIRPALGRDFAAEEDARGANRVVILTHGLWQRRFGGDSGVIGRHVSLDGIDNIVIGVLPATFEYLPSPAATIFAPLGYNTTLEWACHSCRHLRVVARLREGVSRQSAEAELDALGVSLRQRFPDFFDGSGMMTTTMRETVVSDVRPALLAVFGAVLLLLLIACANVANLFLGRAVEREGEFALRSALGAGRGRLVRQMLAETLSVALAGGAIGVALAYAGARGLASLGPRTIPRIEQVGVGGPVLLFAVLVTLGVALLSALLPAVAASRGDVGTMIKGGARQVARGGRHRARRGLVVAELSLSLMLLVGAGLLVRSLERLLAVDTGFETASRLALDVSYTGELPSKEEATWGFHHRAMESVRALPGVRDVAVTSQLPMSGDFDSWGIHRERAPRPSPADDPSAFRFAVSSNYLQLMGIPLRRGRGFTPQDTRGAPLVAIVNEAMVRLDFGGGDPVGERIKMGGMDGPWRTIIGVAGEVRHQGLEQTDERQIYIPFDQNSYADSRMAMIVHASADPESLIPQIRGAIRQLDPRVPVTAFVTLDELLRRSTAQRRFALLVFQLFAGVALLLAAVGIYGVMARSVTERQRELGIRTALGAPRERILAMVVRQGGTLIAGGVLLGVAGALALSRLMRGLLFGVAPNDPLTLVAVSATLAAVALVAVLIPAWRATRVDAMEALRGE